MEKGEESSLMFAHFSSSSSSSALPAQKYGFRHIYVFKILNNVSEMYQCEGFSVNDDSEIQTQYVIYAAQFLSNYSWRFLVLRGTAEERGREMACFNFGKDNTALRSEGKVFAMERVRLGVGL